MKKEYVTPEMDVMDINVNVQLLAGSGGVNPDVDDMGEQED